MSCPACEMTGEKIGGIPDGWVCPHTETLLCHKIEIPGRATEPFQIIAYSDPDVASITLRISSGKKHGLFEFNIEELKDLILPSLQQFVETL